MTKPIDELKRYDWKQESSKLQQLDKLHRESEINFEITTGWDGPMTFRWGQEYSKGWTGKWDYQWKYTESFETLEEGIDWLIDKLRDKLADKE